MRPRRPLAFRQRRRAGPAAREIHAVGPSNRVRDRGWNSVGVNKGTIAWMSQIDVDLAEQWQTDLDAAVKRSGRLSELKK